LKQNDPQLRKGVGKSPTVRMVTKIAVALYCQVAGSVGEWLNQNNPQLRKGVGKSPTVRTSHTF